MNVGFLATVVWGVLFFRAADYEQMSPWLWSVASFGLSGIILLRGGTITLLMLAQCGLFVLMWVYNMRRRARKRG